MRLEFLTPGCARVGEEDVDMVCRFRNFSYQTFDFGYLGAVRRYGDRLCAGTFVGEGV